MIRVVILGKTSRWRNAMSYVPNDFICGLKPRPQNISSGIALTVIFLIVAMLLAARRTWFPAATCRIASRSGPLALLSRIVSCSLPSSASRASPPPLVTAEMKIQPSRGRVKEKVSAAPVAAASNNGAVRLLSLLGCGWAEGEGGQGAPRGRGKVG